LAGLALDLHDDVKFLAIGRYNPLFYSPKGGTAPSPALPNL